MTTRALDSNRHSVAEINIIPLADVLLVLLIIFMVTAPVATQTLSLDLPAPDARKPPLPPQDIMLRIDPAGDVYRNGQLVPAPALEALLRAEAGDPRYAPALRIDASDEAGYEAVTVVLAAARNAGLQKIHFAGGD